MDRCLGQAIHAVLGEMEFRQTFIRRELSISDGRNYRFGGTQEIGWDRASQSIKSWTFNNDGSHSEGAWNIEGNSWIVVTSGVTADGRPSSNTRIYKFPDKDTLVWRLIDGRAGDQSMPTMQFNSRERPHQSR